MVRKVKVKVCGITNHEDAELALRLGADAIGFIFYKKSKRYINPSEASKISLSLPSFAMKVGVFVNEEPDEINRIANHAKLNIVQLHGDETPDFIDHIHLPVIKSFRVNEDFNFSEIDKYKNCGILLDTFNKNEYGGTGEKFNWNIIPNNLKNKIIIAGGISSQNLEKVVCEINPYAVDVSSSIEEYPGKKDKNKLIEFFQKVKNIRGY